MGDSTSGGPLGAEGPGRSPRLTVPSVNQEGVLGGPCSRAVCSDTRAGPQASARLPGASLALDAAPGSSLCPTPTATPGPGCSRPPHPRLHCLEESPRRWQPGCPLVLATEPRRALPGSPAPLLGVRGSLGERPFAGGAPASVFWARSVPGHLGPHQGQEARPEHPDPGQVADAEALHLA